MLLSPTRLGARLARRLTERQLADWRQPSEAAEHIVAELAANAVQHGRVPGRDFRLTLVLDTQRVLRIEVTECAPSACLLCLPLPRRATRAAGRAGVACSSWFQQRLGVGAVLPHDVEAEPVEEPLLGQADPVLRGTDQLQRGFLLGRERAQLSRGSLPRSDDRTRRP